jgi:hypothetical protein
MYYEFLKVLLIALFGAVGAASAATFTYTFEMPAFDRDLGGQPVSGRSSVLAIEVDNGNNTRVNQTYNFSDIVSFTLVSLEGTTIENVRLPNLRAWAGLRDYAFLSTVGLSLPFVELGFAKLDMTGSSIPVGENRSIMFGLDDPSSGFIDVWLGAENNAPLSNPYEYYVRVQSLDIIGVHDQPYVAKSLIIAPVPLPLSALSLLGALGALGLLRRPRTLVRRLN